MSQSQQNIDLASIDFYLSSHDFGNDPQPRMCKVVQKVKGLHANSNYLLVKIAPLLATKFWGGPSADFDQIILAILGRGELKDIGIKPVFADIVICPTYHGGMLDERKCSRIGVGELHATYSEAIRHSPIEAKQ